MSISAATLAAAKKHAEQEIHKAELDDIQLDKSLKKSNYAADAKTVGDKFATVDASLGNRVRFDDYQSLDEDQKAIARSNIGASELTTNSIELYPEDNPQRDTMAASVGAVYDWVEFNNQLNQAGSLGISMAREIVANSSCIKKVKMESPFILLENVADGLIQGGISLLSEAIPPCLFHGGGIAVTYDPDLNMSIMEEEGGIFEKTIPSYYIVETLSEDEIIELRGFPEGSLFEEHNIPALFIVQKDTNLGDITLTRGLYFQDIRILGISMFELFNAQFAPSNGTWENLNLSEDKITRTQTISETKSSFIFKEQLESPEIYSVYINDTSFNLIKISNTIPTLEQLSNFTVYTMLESTSMWAPFDETMDSIYVSSNGGAAVVYEDFVSGELHISAGLYFMEIYQKLKIEGILLEYPGDLEVLKAENKIKHELLPDHLQFGNIPRTFGTARAIDNTLFWDGNMKGLEIAGTERSDGSILTLVKVSDYIPSLEQLEQPWEVALYEDGRKRYIKQTPTREDPIIYTISVYLGVILAETEVAGQKILPGIYFLKSQFFDTNTTLKKSCAYVSQVTIPGADFSPKPGKIDPKYLPGVCVPMVELTTTIEVNEKDFVGHLEAELNEVENAMLNEVAKSKTPIVVNFKMTITPLDGDTLTNNMSAQFACSWSEEEVRYIYALGPERLTLGFIGEKWFIGYYRTS